MSYLAGKGCIDFLSAHCITWVIWKEQNCHTFEDMEKSIIQLMDAFLCFLLKCCTMIGGSLVIL